MKKVSVIWKPIYGKQWSKLTSDFIENWPQMTSRDYEPSISDLFFILNSKIDQK